MGETTGCHSLACLFFTVHCCCTLYTEMNILSFFFVNIAEVE